MSYKSKLKLSALALSVGMVCSAQAAYNPQFSEVYSFGDSLSDMGAMKGTSIDIDLMGMKQSVTIPNNFTTPDGKTAVGHLATNMGKSSDPVYKMKVDSKQISNLVPAILGVGGTNTIEMAQQVAASLPNNQSISNDVRQMTEYYKMVNNADSGPGETSKEMMALSGEAMRLAAKTLIEFGELIEQGKAKPIDGVPVTGSILNYDVNKKGNNFAVGGASAGDKNNNSPIESIPMMGMNIPVNLPMQQPTLKEQVDKYLSGEFGSPKGKADPNAFYTISAGANDLFRASKIKALIAAGAYNKASLTVAIEAVQKKKDELKAQGMSDEDIAKQSAAINAIGQTAAKNYLTNLVTSNITDSAQEVAAQTKRLMAAGAKYVMVTNMPDVTDTPDFEQTKQTILATARKTAIDQARAEDSKNTLDEAALKKIGDEAEAKALATTVVAAQAETQAAVNGFNQMLQASLGKSSVIYIDINKFLKTVKADPQKFGFDAAKANQTFCDGTSLMCSPKDAKLKEQLAAIDSDKATSAEQKATAKQQLIAKAGYIFADGVHPSSAVHKYLADVVTNGYLRAPGYHASMQSLARSGQNELAELFEGRRTALDANPLKKGELRPYVNVSGSKRDGAEHENLAKGNIESMRLYAAMDYGISEQTGGGIMLNVQRDKQDFKKDMAGKQEREAYIAGAYLNQRITENWSWGVNGYVGKGNYDQERNYTVGNGIDTNAIVAVKNTGETDSIMAGGSLGANGHYQMSGIDLLPRVNLNYQYERINSYAEKTTVAGAVKFDDATLKRTELALGLNVSKTFQVSGMAVMPYADLDWRQQLAGDKDQEVNWKTEASTNGYINEIISETDRSFGTVKVGGQVEIVKGLTTQLSYSKKFGSSLSNGDRIMLDLGYTF